MENLAQFIATQKRRREPGLYPIKEIDLNVSLIQLVLDECVPPLGAEDYFPTLFGKYGYTFTGICDGWRWDKERLNEASSEELWQMLAISAMYWQSNYELWYEELQDKMREKINEEEG